MTKTIRLDKYLTDCRTGSRSEVKNHIRKGLVSVNGATCTDPATHIRTSDHVTLDGRTVEYKQHVYYMLNKPAGYVSDDCPAVIICAKSRLRAGEREPARNSPKYVKKVL